MDFPAGELPFERQVHALAALDSEDLAIMFYDGAGDPHGFFSHVLLPPNRDKPEPKRHLSQSTRRPQSYKSKPSSLGLNADFLSFSL
jgi:hypothetical protein